MKDHQRSSSRKLALVLALFSLPALTGAQLANVSTETGKIFCSVDGLGTSSGSGSIQVERPSAASTVRKAFLSSATFTAVPIADGTVTLGGIAVNGNVQVTSSFFDNSFADITASHGALLNAVPVGISSLSYSESAELDGSTLCVIWDYPEALTVQTSLIYFGGQDPLGDQFTISLLDPIDLSDPNLRLDMGLGISFSAQDQSDFAGSNLCGQDSGMSSEICVNSITLTRSAGNCDDGDPTQTLTDGNLYTVGGIGDTNANPTMPNAVPPCPLPSFVEDELYDLIPFVNDGDTQIVVDTINPSLDDNIHFAWICTSGVAVAGDVMFVPPSPCFQKLTVGVGLPLNYTVTAVDTQGAPVTLDATGTPAGATHTPVPPTVGNPASTNFSWTPTNADLGTHVITYTADNGTDVVECEVTICVTNTECFLVIGDGKGAAQWDAGLHEWQTQISQVTESYAVLIDDIPSFPVPQALTSSNARYLVDHFTAQVLMYNPEVFPSNPEQYTNGLEVWVWSDGRVMASRYGTRDNMSVRVQTYTDASGQKLYRLPFRIGGL